ncbi:DUF1223 domain-containing protein [Brevundimonas sp. NIBR11]|uniref:DUF1223 domain-containing protein n=1 Tax=Brevundimonas sp. NIBR11 TaxID=3015999 RepID=UPI0022F01335|nr:DUF1223 domain-containing protein [Brevundimonas sp. NIBR11]WGM32455.1 hypothetical protein KKHFBJBL_02707 [Brevundimonas sp. NIBR11]
MNLRGIIIAGVAALGLFGAVGSTAQPAGPRPVRLSATTDEPVVVELFTAQGCSGCPAANEVVEGLAEEPGIIALTYAVDYWDYLGWPDTFAKPEFAQRQRAYQTAMRLRNVYTPQVIIDGRRQLSGAEGSAIQVAVDEEAARRIFPPQVQFRESGDAVGVGSGRAPSGGADVWAVSYRPGTQTVTVAGGDNRGRAVRHVNVVRSLTRLGEWTGRPILLDLPQAADPADKVVVMVQSRADRRILSAATR